MLRLAHAEQELDEFVFKSQRILRRLLDVSERDWYMSGVPYRHSRQLLTVRRSFFRGRSIPQDFVTVCE